MKAPAKKRYQQGDVYQWGGYLDDQSPLFNLGKLVHQVHQA